MRRVRRVSWVRTLCSCSRRRLAAPLRLSLTGSPRARGACGLRPVPAHPGCQGRGRVWQEDMNSKMPSPGGQVSGMGEGRADKLGWWSGLLRCVSQIGAASTRYPPCAFARSRLCASGLNLLMNQSARDFAIFTRSSAFLEFMPSLRPCAI